MIHSTVIIVLALDINSCVTWAEMKKMEMESCLPVPDPHTSFALRE